MDLNFHPFYKSRDRMVVGFTTAYALSAKHHYICEFEPRSWRGVLDTTLGDNVCQWLTTGRWFSLGTPVSSINKTDCHDITEILLKVALNTIIQPNHSILVHHEYLINIHNLHGFFHFWIPVYIVSINIH
jgi:hypothetical protein